MRLDKFLSDNTPYSRKELKEIIKSGRVTVNGIAATVPDFRTEPETDKISLDGKLLVYSQFHYVLMNKPAGVLTATEDKNRQTVLDLLPQELKHLKLFPVGRLDIDTEGLLLLTDNGEYAHRVISPSSGVKKVYYAETEGIPNMDDVSAFAGGIVLKDGLHCLPAELEPLGGNRCLVTVCEGKYHQVKRMLASRGKPVTRLRRLSVGGLELPHDLQPGGCISLTEADAMKALY